MAGRTKAVTKIRALIETGEAVSFSTVRAAHPELLPGAISAAFCYLIKKGDTTREQVANTTARKQTHKKVWQYRMANIDTIR